MELSTILLLAAGLALLAFGAELLVRGASRLAIACGISPLVIGLTVVAYGTSMPELVVSVLASANGQPDLSLGNAVGSNIFNVLFILGLCAAILPLAVAHKLVRIDVPLVIGASVLLFLLGLDGSIGRADGALLIAGLAAYTIFSIRQSRRESRAVQQEYEAGVGALSPAVRVRIPVAVGLVLAGLALLVLGSRWLVTASIEIALALGVSELVIGLTIVAAGTSLPEVATSVVAAMRGERDIAVGNVVGSNLFNILGVLGVAAAIAPVGVSPTALRFDIPIMIGVAVACLPIFFTGYAIARWEGFLFLGYYVAYVAFLMLDAGKDEALGSYAFWMSVFVLPLTGVTLAVLLVRALRRGRAGTT